jgi:hypothetical protein
MSSRWTYNRDHRKRPHFHPVATPSGAVLTRDSPDDHPWHHGLWFTIKYVNEENFWEEQPPYGVLRHVDDTTIHWIRPDRETVVIVEDIRIDEVELAEDAYAIDLNIVLTPQVDVLLDRTPFTTWGGYGGLALRGRPDWTDTRLLLADGTVFTDERLLGVPSAWCDLSGRVDGGEGGILIVPDSVTPWYGSTKADNYASPRTRGASGDEGWSNFLNAAFLWDGPERVAARQPRAFGFRVVVHDGIWSRERCAAYA